MDTLTSIKVFRQVVESGSFVAAADRMDLSTAMVSKHVAYIEKRLGVRLLNRNSRTLSLTEAGSVYFERCKTILDDLEATELELGSLGSAPRGTLRVTCPSWFARQRLADALAEFRRRYPEILVDVSFEDRRVDLVEEGYDLALRVSPEASLPAGLIARPVRTAHFFIAASREYLKRNGTPKSPEELARHDFVAVGNLDAITLTGPKGKIEVPLRVVLRYRSMGGVAHAVAAGIGLAPLPDILFEEAEFKGVLTAVLTDYPLRAPTLYMVYVSRRYLPLKIRAFIDFVIEWTATVPMPKLAQSR
ncbi:MAG TPA: LysR family transcriptional regulator [Steroidobacteraceae bacterium]|nr:LysR family transcriptional regulator [Steroidobacteraceae bacterium]